MEKLHGNTQHNVREIPLAGRASETLATFARDVAHKMLAESD